MASVNWGGNHGNARCSKADHVKGINLLKHCDQKFRSDPNKQHSNEEIDPSKSYLNQNFTGMGWKESKEKWERRLKELDATGLQTQRKDRIELTSLEMPVPEGMTNEQAKEFFQDFYDMCVERFGEENIIGATSHYVTAELDAGPIIEQDVTRISHKDTPESLVLKGKDLEKIVLSRAVTKHIQRKVLTYNNKTIIFQ